MRKEDIKFDLQGVRVTRFWNNFNDVNEMEGKVHKCSWAKPSASSFMLSCLFCPKGLLVVNAGRLLAVRRNALTTHTIRYVGKFQVGGWKLKKAWINI